MLIKEHAYLLGKSKSLVGVISEPDNNDREGKTAVILLNSGILHRVGPNRIYVKIARCLASLGLPALRFDFSGIGDSENTNDKLPLEDRFINETRQVMDFLEETKGFNKFVLAGICSGADVSFKVALKDLRVAGTVLIDWFAYFTLGFHFSSYSKRLLMPRSWFKLISGKSGFWSTLRRAYLAQKSSKKNGKSRDWHIPTREQAIQDIRVLNERGVQLLFIFSGGSPAYYNYRKYFKSDLEKLIVGGGIDIKLLKESDHGFTLNVHQKQLTNEVCEWMKKFV